ncbi:MAG: asparagine synthase (glutamine-hydrolyzing) [Chitinophagales bacterium]|nr:asparagine synthase (glutamine-hydrolyzing) [Chitinophagales bacterium]
MCGFTGYYSKTHPVDEQVFHAMTESLKHRGPDGVGYYFSSDRKTAIGHTRLAIIDLSESGKQPMSNEDGTLWLASNGEIYNYKELRIELQKKGHVFKSTTDVEVILHGYEEWGSAVVNKLEGMFAFVVWDEKKSFFFLARDRFGMKPLYYYADEERFVFASELKGIISDKSVPREINYSALMDYLTYRYVPSPKSIFKNISKLPPAHFLEYSNGSISAPSRYWDLPRMNTVKTFDNAVNEARQYLKDSIEKHLLSDVPLGLFLSGGLDSGAIAYFLSTLGYQAESFTMGFNDWAQSEHELASLTAKTFRHPLHSKMIGAESIYAMKELAYFFDEPLADVSIIPTYLNSKEARQHVKSVLSGDGGDEVFAGYTWHQGFAALIEEQEGGMKTTASGVRVIPAAVDYYALNFAASRINHENLRFLLCDDLHKEITEREDWLYLKNFEQGMSPVKSLQLLDFRTFLSEMALTKVDRVSMACSLEVRMPFLDRQLVEYMFSLDESVYFQPGKNKTVLREMLNGRIDKGVLNKPKSGFVGPNTLYDDSDFFKETLSGASLVKDGLINQIAIDSWMQQRDFNKLWSLAVLEMWYSTWVK